MVHNILNSLDDASLMNAFTDDECISFNVPRKQMKHRASTEDQRIIYLSRIINIKLCQSQYHETFQKLQKFCLKINDSSRNHIIIEFSNKMFAF